MTAPRNRRFTKDFIVSATPKRIPTRVFRSGNSQAVRIPKAFALPEGEVLIEQRADGLFIRGMRANWEEFFAKAPLGADLDAVELRATGLERPIEFDLSANSRPTRRRTK